ncbi:MAG: MOSC domain-containing protein [Ktedonobacteraceae bacterium]
MWNGHVVSLHITTAEAQPTIDIQEAHAVPGKGLEGDRYFLGTGYFSRHHGPSYELTLIEGETIDALNEEFDELHIHARDARRNVVTRGVPLNHLVAHRFQVGEVTVRGIRLCHPCLHIAKITHHNMLSGLINRGGLRAQILTEGIIRLGDPIVDLGEEQVLPDTNDAGILEDITS